MPPVAALGIDLAARLRRLVLSGDPHLRQQLDAKAVSAHLGGSTGEPAKLLACVSFFAASFMASTASAIVSAPSSVALARLIS